MTPPVELLNVDQLAAFLHRKPGGIRKAAQRGELPVAAKTRRPLTWLRSDWERWAASPRTVAR